ncbi:MAG TPA: hypothetical protein VJW73_16755, partial [Gemmatimonadaceae bacterium]|nr:hypothetical protein [Gemmatimonadaceae bacterium]
MASPLAPVPSTGTPFIPVEPQAGAGARVVAALGAIIVLLGGALFSLGGVFFAPLGMLTAAAIWRKRGRVLSMVGHWLAALVGVAVVIAAFGAVTAAFVPKGSLDEIRRSMDSATTAAAVQSGRASPADSAARRAARRATSSSRGMAVMLAYGFGFAGILMVAFFGTIGWIGGMLLGYAVNGRWPGTVP